MRMPFMKHVTWYLIITMFIIGIVPKVDAGFAPSEIIALSQGERTADLQRIQNIEARQRVGQRVALQGNLDPAILLADPGVIRTEARRCLGSFGRGPGHVFNLGHGITPDVEPANLQALIDAVAELSPANH